MSYIRNKPKINLKLLNVNNSLIMDKLSWSYKWYIKFEKYAFDTCRIAKWKCPPANENKEIQKMLLLTKNEII